jgi:hypothetical protein
LKEVRIFAERGNTVDVVMQSDGDLGFIWRE